MNARRNEEEEAFLPPYRSVRFNQELNHDDGLLLGSIADIYDMDAPQAEQLLATWIDDFAQQLEDEGCADFGAIGLFTRDDAGNLAFTSQESGVTTPDYYGLDAFHMGEVQPEPKAKVIPLTTEADDKEITIHINRRIANYVAAACAAILLFVVFNLPAQREGNEIRSSLKEMLMPATTSVSQPTTNSRTEATPSASAAEAMTLATQTADVTPASKEFCIVMASAISQTNAENYAAKLNERGFVSARVLAKGKMVRVVVGHYTTEEAAQQGARDIRGRSNEYAGAWVMSL